VRKRHAEIALAPGNSGMSPRPQRETRRASNAERGWSGMVRRDSMLAFLSTCALLTLIAAGPRADLPSAGGQPAAGLGARLVLLRVETEAAPPPVVSVAGVNGQAPLPELVRVLRQANPGLVFDGRAMVEVPLVADRPSRVVVVLSDPAAVLEVKVTLLSRDPDMYSANKVGGRRRSLIPVRAVMTIHRQVGRAKGTDTADVVNRLETGGVWRLHTLLGRPGPQVLAFLSLTRASPGPGEVRVAPVSSDGSGAESKESP